MSVTTKLSLIQIFVTQLSLDVENDTLNCGSFEWCTLLVLLVEFVAAIQAI